LGQRRGGKKKHAGREDGIFVHPQNGFNALILNWCIGGCWFPPAIYVYIYMFRGVRIFLMIFLDVVSSQPILTSCPPCPPLLLRTNGSIT